jgi:dolichyl-phosphate beta-glucosyltransferase
MMIFKQFVGLWGVKSVKDTQCGFKLMSRQAALAIIPNLRLNRWIFDVELIYLAEKLGVPIQEVSVNWIEIEGSKLCLATDSVKMATDLILMRLAYAFRIWTVHTTKSKGES